RPTFSGRAPAGAPRTRRGPPRTGGIRQLGRRDVVVGPPAGTASRAACSADRAGGLRDQRVLAQLLRPAERRCRGRPAPLGDRCAVSPVEARALSRQDPDGRDEALPSGAASGSSSPPRSCGSTSLESVFRSTSSSRAASLLFPPTIVSTCWA